VGGLARRAGVIDTFRGRGEAILVLDAGDTLLPNLPPSGAEPTPLDQARAATMMQAHGMLGLDAFAPGEIDLALGAETLSRLARQASLTLLCANLLDAKGAPVATPRRLLEVGEGAGKIRVGLFGLFELPAAEPPLPPRLRLKVSDPIAAARVEVAALQKEGAELIVMLAHLGMPRAREVARAVKGIHLGVVAHSGYRTSEPERVPETGALLVESGRRGQSLGRVEVRLGEGWGTGAALTDDSRRFVLHLEASAELERVRKGLAAASAPTLRRRIHPSLERARLLAGQLRDLRPPAASHTVIATLTDLDEQAPENSAMKAFTASARGSWPAPSPIAPQLLRVRRAPRR
jgi:2',3'-cyclic-nucleotide 2'-phosphodiesterase (5'-nucleotidase family)